MRTRLAIMFGIIAVVLGVLLVGGWSLLALPAASAAPPDPKVGLKLVYPDQFEPAGTAAADGLFPDRWFTAVITWGRNNLEDQDLNFTVEVVYQDPHIVHFTDAPVPIEWNEHVTNCTHDEANHKFDCEGVFPESDPDPVQYLEGWIRIAFIGTCGLYEQPRPTQVTINGTIVYIEDPSTDTAGGSVPVEPALDLSLLSQTPRDGTTDVIIEDRNGQGPLLSWSPYLNHACGDGSDPFNQDVAYLVRLRKWGGEWRAFDEQFPTCDKQLRLAPTDLECEENGAPGRYEWDASIADIRYAQCGAVAHNVARFATGTCRPEVDLQQKYGDYFLSGLGIENVYRAEVDWNGSAFEGPPDPPYGKVVFDLNETTVEKNGLSWGAEHTYNMGSDFSASLSGGNNVLRVKAVTPGGDESLEQTLQPKVYPVPGWITQFALSSFQIDLQARTVKYGRQIEYPNPHFEARYRVPGWVPYLGGADMGILETYAGVGAEACSDGSGNVGLQGATGAQLTEDKKVMGRVSGQGDVRLGGNYGLDLTEARFGLNVRGEISEEMGIADLIPALRAAEDWWLVGRLVKWFNQRATVEAAIGPEIDIQTKFVDVDDALQFRSGTGTGLIDMALTLTLRVLDSLKASLTGGGTPRVVVQVPASGSWGYLKEIAIRLYAKAAITVWRFEEEWERGITCSLPEGDCEGDEGRVRGSVGTSSGFQLMGRDYVTDGYATFTANRAIHGAEHALAPHTVTEEMQIVSNVFPLADPTLAVRADGVRMLLWVHDEESKPVAQGEEIAAARFNGTAWITSTVTGDNYQDFSPQVAFDADGDAVALWERSVAVHISPTLDITYVQSFEIGSAQWISGTTAWSNVVTLTEDTLLDTAPQLARGQDGSLMALWRTSDGHDLLGTPAHPLTLTYAAWDGGAWSTPVPALTGLTDTLDVDLAVYSATLAALVLARDTDGDVLTGTDAELYYATYDGAVWSGLIPLTSDVVTDTAPALSFDTAGEPVIAWQRGDDLVMLSGWAGSPTLVRSSSTSGAFLDYELLPDPDGNLALLWQAISDDGPDLTYAVYDEMHGSWSNDNVLMADGALEESIAPAFAADGTLYVAYNKVALEMITQTVEVSPTLTITVTNIPNPIRTDLYLLSHTIGRDLAIDDTDVAFSDPNPAPGGSVLVSATVHNLGDLAVAGGQVVFYDGDPAAGGSRIGVTQTLASPFRAATTDTVDVTWNVSSGVSSHVIYVVVDPEDRVAESNEANNQATRAAVQPDLTVPWVHSTYTTDTIALTAAISNLGHLTATTPFSIAFRAVDPVTGTTLGAVTVGDALGASEQITVTLSLTDPARLFGLGQVMWAVADAGSVVVEADEDNNADYAALRVLPDLTLDAVDIQLGDGVTVTVHNAGVVTATDAILAVWRGGLGGDLVYTGTLSDLGPGASGSAHFACSEDCRWLWAMVDPDDGVAETSEINNLAVRLNCPRPLSSVQIAGPTRGSSDTLYAFSATVVPTDATGPITYTWAPTPAPGSLLLPSGSVATYTWDLPTTYTITVTAENCGGSDVATHTIAIEPPIHEIFLPLVMRAYAPPAAPDRYVRRYGTDSGDCATVETACGTIQYALDRADAGDVIGIAGYTDAYSYPGDPGGNPRWTYWATNSRPKPEGYYGPDEVSQVVYISKTLTLRGGYTTDFTAWNPDVYKTVLRPGLGGFVARVVLVAPGASPTLEWLHILEGDATYQGGVYNIFVDYESGGGGILAEGTFNGNDTITIRNCVIAGNVASTNYNADGGGVYLHYRDNAGLVDNTVYANTASSAGGLAYGWGGGIGISSSDNVVVSGNIISGNVTNTGYGRGNGAGLRLYESNGTTVTANEIYSNTANESGGGIHVRFTNDLQIIDNTIHNNVAAQNQTGYGGGIDLFYAEETTLRGNAVYSNTSTRSTATDHWGLGGGIAMNEVDRIQVVGNVITGNVANPNHSGTGGGLRIWVGQGIVIEDNLIIGNRATLSATASGVGDGVRVSRDTAGVTVVNNVVAGNRGSTSGSSGMAFVAELSSQPIDVTLLHNTVADNGAYGILVQGYTTLNGINTILSGHTLSISVTHPASSTVALDHTLWHGNAANYSSGIAHTSDRFGDPAFVAPATWDYHIGSGSEAIDQGVDAGVVADLDGDPRPQGGGYDIGADEYMATVWRR